MDSWVRLAVGCAVLAAVAVAVLQVSGIGHSRMLLIAALRAAAQLAIVAAALRGVFAAPVAVVAVVAVMFGVASWTATRRLHILSGAGRAVLLSCGAGALVSIGLIVGAPVLDRSVRDLVAVSGIVIGGTMTAATLAGRRLLDGLRSRRDEIEAWLSIGATSREAVRDVARSAAGEALIPALDQTRTVGLVTLPGAFVGALLGGASAAGAARFQLAVLIGLLCAESITAALLVYLLGAPDALPGGEPVTPSKRRRRLRSGVRARRSPAPTR